MKNQENYRYVLRTALLSLFVLYSAVFFYLSRSIFNVSLLLTFETVLYLFLVRDTYWGFLVCLLQMITVFLVSSSSQQVSLAFTVFSVSSAISLFSGLGVHVGHLRRQSRYINWGIILAIVNIILVLLLGLISGYPIF